MSHCEQAPGLTIFGHGVLVHLYYRDLHSYITGGKLSREWRLPDWINDPRLQQASSPEKLRDYHVMHDCGKPFCRRLDENGRQHFPDHANISADLYLKAGGDQFTADLIRQDMDIHLLKADDCEEFAKKPRALDLLLTGLAEIHANAKMFGGFESTSFKIKFKHITQRGKKILTFYLDNGGR